MKIANRLSGIWIGTLCFVACGGESTNPFLPAGDSSIVVSDSAAGDSSLAGDSAVDDMGTNSDSASNPPVTLSYVISEFAILAPSNGVAPGFDLDRMAGGAASGTCQQIRPDFINASGANIDNGFAAFYGSMASLVDQLLAVPGCTNNCLAAFFTARINAGRFVLLVRLTDVNNLSNDSSVGIETFAVANYCAAGPCLATSAGRLSSGQSFRASPADRTSMTIGRIVNGRLSADIGNFVVPFGTDTISVPLTLQNAKLDASVTATTLSSGNLGGSINLDILAQDPAVTGSQAAAIVPLLRSQADMTPCGPQGVCALTSATSSTCRDMSLGASVSAVQAVILDR